MIKTIKGKRTKEFHSGKRVKAFESFRRQAEMKLDQLDAAFVVGDLKLPDNHLEALQGARRGKQSIRINDRWRICFEWPKGCEGPMDVEIVVTTERPEYRTTERTTEDRKDESP